MQSSIIFREIDRFLQAVDENKLEELIRQVKGAYEFRIKKGEQELGVFTLDLNQGTVVFGKGSKEPDTVMIIADNDFVSLAKGKLNGQRAFMLGKIKILGKVALASKLDKVFKQMNRKSKL